MQTFLPYPDFQKSASVLDWRRLGKQRVEAFQILKTLETGRKGWANHPAVQMWYGYNQALGLYMNTMILEWIKRGYKNTMWFAEVSRPRMPPWIGSEQFHSSHRSNLLRKDFSYYSQFNWPEPANLAYVWPGKELDLGL
jgi:hypothetical protein